MKLLKTPRSKALNPLFPAGSDARQSETNAPIRTAGNPLSRARPIPQMHSTHLTAATRVRFGGPFFIAFHRTQSFLFRTHSFRATRIMPD